MLKSYIGYSSDPEIRCKATSGGVGTSLIKYLFDTNLIDYSLSFEFEQCSLSYKPKLISSFSDYTICGSIYQEMDLINYLKNIITSDFNGKRFALFCLPCQAAGIRHVFKSVGASVILLGLTCSSQQSIEATEYLLDRLKINNADVSGIQYRGNGWPGGIAIMLKDGQTKYIPNNGSLWSEIFHSRLFIQKRCFYCSNTLNKYSDIVLADPWLKDIKDEERIGKTLLGVYTEIGLGLIIRAEREHAIIVDEINCDMLSLSQKGTILRKDSYNRHPLVRKWMIACFLESKYHDIVKKTFLFKLHMWLKSKIEKRML